MFVALPSLSQADGADGILPIPDVKLHGNPSAFNVYCSVRLCVLDWQQREASLALASRSSVQSGDSDSEEEEECREPVIKLPKVSSGVTEGVTMPATLGGIDGSISSCFLHRPSLSIRSLRKASFFNCSPHFFRIPYAEFHLHGFTENAKLKYFTYTDCLAQ